MTKLRASSPTGVGHVGWVLGALLATGLVSGQARATLGEDAASVAADQRRLQATVKVVQKPGHAVHDMQVPGGATIHQFVSDEGKVFAVSWAGGWRPNLRDLMGQHYERYVAAARQQRRGHGPLRIELPGLVVVMGG
ncbi:MAG TPA: DUF2844 domain-containing protein, partial [Polyangia bacterium]|nr:DUF2844 domain-containing protein [Polyangia bacterium]